jgi:hypothetical protein
MNKQKLKTFEEVCRNAVRTLTNAGENPNKDAIPKFSTAWAIENMLNAHHEAILSLQKEVNELKKLLTKKSK